MRPLPFLFVLLFACGDDDVPADVGSDVMADVSRDVASDDALLDTSIDTRLDTSDALDAAVDVTVDTAPPIDPVADAGAVELVASDYMGQAFGFLEGPHFADGRLYFSDLFFGRPERNAVYALTQEGTLEVVLRPSEGANGLAMNRAGQLIACLQAGRRVARIENGALTTLFERFEGSRLNAPNDLVFRSDGRWYFTDPGYGAENSMELDSRAVYLVDDGTPTQVWRGTLSQRPNGIMLSPDESTLYLADTADDVVRAFDVESSGALSAERVFESVPDPDGMTADEAGNLYVATGNGVEVFAPDGTRWGVLEVPMRAANVAFGGAERRTLYITARTALYSASMPIPGVAGR